MSFTYLFELKSNKEVIDTMTTDDMSQGFQWSESNSLIGDLVVVSEAYMGADGALEAVDHVTSYYVDF